MKVGITGHKGFIGSSISKKLLKEGHEVVCLDKYTRSNIIDGTEINNYPNDFIFKERIMSNGRFYISSLAARKREIDSGNIDILTEKEYLEFLLKTSTGIISGK